MAVLWESGPSTVSQIRVALSKREINLAHNTVLTILRILEEKGRVGRTLEGRAHRYAALVAREAAGASAITRLLETVFGGSADQLLTHLAHDPRFSPSEIRRLRHLLNERLAKGDPG